METLIFVWGVTLPYLIGFFGWFLYCYFLFHKAKEKADTTETDFDWPAYKKKNWDNWLWSLLLVPVLVSYMPDIVAILNSLFGTEIPHYAIYDLGCGPFTELLYMGIVIVSKRVGAIYTKLTQ